MKTLLLVLVCLTFAGCGLLPIDDFSQAASQGAAQATRNPQVPVTGNPLNDVLQLAFYTLAGIGGIYGTWRATLKSYLRIFKRKR